MSSKTKENRIPKPCSENWLEMNAEEKSRFCLLCQKNIFVSNTAEMETGDPNTCLRYTTNATHPKPNLLKKVSTLFKK